jgi:hypothetical protein
VRRYWSEWRRETFACGLSQQAAVAEGSLIRVVAGRAGAALTKPGRASTARWRGSGERGGKEYARNRRFTSFIWDTGSNLVDTGRAQCAPLPLGAAGTSGKYTKAVPGGHGESLRRTHGDAAGAQPGSSSAERVAVNTGSPAPEGPWSRVAGMQAKLHRWAAADPGRRV